MPIRALLHGFGNAGITGWFLLFMLILISEFLAQKRNVSEFWVGKLHARNAHKVHSLYSSQWPWRHEMLIRADSVLTNMQGMIQLFNKCCLQLKSEKNRGGKKKKNKVSHLHAGHKS